MQTLRIHDRAHKAPSAEEKQKGLFARVKDDFGGKKKERSTFGPVKWRR